jgi:hypothetical protein
MLTWWKTRMWWLDWQAVWCLIGRYHADGVR